MIAVISVDLSPVGNMLATGSGDKEARICEFSLVSLFLPRLHHELHLSTGSYQAL